MTAGSDAGVLLRALREPGPLTTVELRPPPSNLPDGQSIGEWIDLHHSLSGLAREGLFVFLTDNAVGAAEEESLAHVGANLDDDTDRSRIVPILTTKHSLEYCEMFASRAAADGFSALTVLGGDRDVGAPRCLPHGRDLREHLHRRQPDLVLGGWANPHREAEEQVGFLTAPDAHADFALTQVVSHHSLAAVERFVRRAEEEKVRAPIVFGVFFYRSPNPRTLETLGRFFPVPAEGLTADFAAGASPEEVCARTIRELRAVGAEKVYVSNLGNRGAARRLRRILDRV